ncbi:hypothetical protein [Microbulbifer yueqingensis]|uniref:Uncharacterized protein n=1 Tax=Microbulbifer yueqingensis TaxID=658219 RepID=A0A1G8ZSB4_9GAMM|nr:hypothetical protein [Microbulbifer yueqingensis]SDK17931.1 hypothetical protein SAMN05216212_1735 [Microbulbifer yueqingensis]
MRDLVSLLIALMLCIINFTLPRWKIFQGGAPSALLSISAGTGLTYVFLVLLPKLAQVQATIPASTAGSAIPGQNHVYLVALTGFVIFLLLLRKDLAGGGRRGRGWSTGTVLVAVIFSLYNAQVGYFLGDWPIQGVGGYLLAGIVLGLHIMGLNYHIWHYYPHHYERSFRSIFCVFMLLGWLAAILTDRLYGVMTVATVFITGAIIITAIREEIPARNEKVHVPFFLGAILVSAFVILTLQETNTGGAS